MGRMKIITRGSNLRFVHSQHKISNRIQAIGRYLDGASALARLVDCGHARFGTVTGAAGARGAGARRPSSNG
eukprot:2498019-Prymnesium_polylepis.1